MLLNYESESAESTSDTCGASALSVRGVPADDERFTLAAPGELWVTRTVHDVIAGSRVLLDNRGEHSLKGFDEPWRLYAVRE